MSDVTDFPGPLLDKVQNQAIQVHATTTAAQLAIQHNGTLVAAETALDFEDASGIVFTVADDAVNTRVKVTPVTAAGGDATGPLSALAVGAKKILATMLGSGVAAAGTVATADGAGGVTYAAAGTKTYRVSTPVVVNTTVAATALINQTLAANDLGSTRVLRLSCGGDWKQNSGATPDLPRFQLSLGGTVLLDTGSPGVAIPNAATRYGWWIEARIAEANATNVQSVRITGTVSCGAVAGAGATAFTTGEGVYRALLNSTGSMGEFTGWNSATKDGTGTLALVLNVINASASATYETVMKDALIVIE